MDIKVLGTGCAKCNKLEALAREVVGELKVKATVEKVTDLKEIAKTGVFLTPGLTIDGKIKVSGKLPSKEELMETIQNSAR
jgi:small redox-active disulfide protein 2